MSPAALGFVLSACAGGGSPDYADARAIADALNDGGISCVLGAMAAAEAFGAQSTGTCEGSDFIVRIYVYAKEDEREERLQTARDHACRQHVSKGSYVSAARWFVTLDAPATTDPKAVYMSDVAKAIGGKRIPQDCD